MSGTPLPPLAHAETRRDVEDSRRRERLAAQAAHRDGTAPERVALSVPRCTHYLGLVRKVVSDLAARAGFARDEIDKIELAVDEACSNAMLYQVDPRGHARQDGIDLEVTLERPRFTVTLRDAGMAYAFEDQGNFDLEDHLRRVEPGGLGICIIKHFMDEVSYEHARGKNVLTMVKLLP